MRRFTKVAIATATVIGSAMSTAGFAATVPAKASASVTLAVHASAVSPNTTRTNVELCTLLGSSDLCMSGYDGSYAGGAGGLVKGFQYSPGPITAHTGTDVMPASNCGGKVTYEPNASPPVFCPFTEHFLDNSYRNDDIVLIKNHANQYSYRGINDNPGSLVDDVVVESSSGDGQRWVEAGSLSSGSELINVSDSDANNNGNVYGICPNGVGSVLAVVSIESVGTGDCDWIIPVT